MKKILCMVLLALCFLLFVKATNNDENQGGVAYGSAAQRDTNYVSWGNKAYFDTYSFDNFGIHFKLLTAAADTVIISTTGSNQRPDSLRFYYEIRADTLLLEGAGADTLFGDSSIVINLPYGTSLITSVMSRYLRFEVITADTTSGVGATATIGDSYIAK